LWFRLGGEDRLAVSLSTESRRGVGEQAKETGEALLLVVESSKGCSGSIFAAGRAELR
jgi:hypothetical protein